MRKLLLFVLFSAGLAVAASVTLGPAPLGSPVATVSPSKTRPGWTTPVRTIPKNVQSPSAITDVPPGSLPMGDSWTFEPLTPSADPSAAAVALTTQPTMLPTTTQPVVIRPTPPLPPHYHALLGRSLFANPRSSVAILASHTVVANGPGATLVLRGVGVSDGVRTAYIEDMTARQITRHREGDVLAGGRIGALSIDQMVFESGGARATVKPGQNLFGQFVAAPPPAPAASQPATPGGPQPPTQPAMPPAAEQMLQLQGQKGMILRSMQFLEESN